jgi:hypothetical protein
MSTEELSGKTDTDRVMIPSWTERFPDRSVLRREAESMALTFVDVLLEDLGRQEIEGIYLKGSAQKEWESPLDYVPELSDVDIHLLLVDGSPVLERLRDPGKGLELQSRVESVYCRENPTPLHMPRPQLILLNMLELEEDYIPSPLSTIRVLFGRDYPKGDYSQADLIRRMDCRRLAGEEGYLRDFGLGVIDKPGKYLWTSLRSISWHVSPSGPRILSLLGVPPEEAWSVNRTRAVAMLGERGEEAAARDYADYYTQGWAFFLSGGRDNGAARFALSSGLGVLKRGVEVAGEWLRGQQS